MMTIPEVAIHSKTITAERSQHQPHHPMENKNQVQEIQTHRTTKTTG